MKLLRLAFGGIALFVLGACRAPGDPVGERAAALTSSGADDLRTGWYPDQPQIAPSLVSANGFGKIFSTAVDGQVYAQPLVAAGTLFIATETNHLYGLDPQSGNVLWSRALGTAVASTDIGCGDLEPSIGVTGTPAIDPDTNTAYLFSKRYINGNSGTIGMYAHAVDVATGVERAGFPVLVAGQATSDPHRIFDARVQSQRPGVVLSGGALYAAFASHCDHGLYTGWVVRVSLQGQLSTLWSSLGGGIWQSGAGLLSDGPGQLIFATGNNGSPSGSIPGKSPPPNLGESLVRLTLQSDGRLQPTDFFAPYDAPALDSWDADFGAGGPMGLPSTYFGTPGHQNLMVMAGKQGYVYLLDRDDFGGIGNGSGGGDAVVGRIGPYGGVWSKPAVWPGDGGYIYMPTASPGDSAGGSFGNLRVYHFGVDGNGKPALSLSATSTDQFGFGSSAAVITSDGVQSGSALVWLVWSPAGDGEGAQLRAYDALPVDGNMQVRYAAAIGTAAKFTPPGVGPGRIYVGTRDGHVLGFGGATPPPLSGQGADLGNVIIGDSASATLTVTASAALTITGVTSSNDLFALDAPGLPRALQPGQSYAFDVTFEPSTPGLQAATLTVQTSAGPLPLAVSGRGVPPQAVLAATPTALSLGGTTPGGHLAGSIVFQNTGGVELTIVSVTAPAAPFSVLGAPAAGRVLHVNESITVTVNFDPVSLASFGTALALQTSAGDVSVPITAMCTPPGHLTISPLTVPYGNVAVGSTKTATFTLSNSGGSALTVLKSKPPALGVFHATTQLPEGTVLAAGASLVETVAFTPAQSGAASDTWTLTADDNAAVQTVTFQGTGTTVATPAADITLQGAAIAFITAPLGGGNHHIQTVYDGRQPAQGSNDDGAQYDTWTGDAARPEDWIGYQFSTARSFSGMTFQAGKQFVDGGWFATINVQVREGGVWTTVPATFTPPYAGHDGVNFRTYDVAFGPVSGDAVRIDGAPGGSAHFISVGELRVRGAP